LPAEPAAPAGGSGTPARGQELPSRSELRIIEPLCAVFRRALKDVGLKYTPERAMILDTIVRFESAFEADRLLSEVRAGGFRVSKATVYRTIKLLSDAGIIERVRFDRDQAVYRLTHGRRPGATLLRLDTREEIELESAEIEAACAALCASLGLALRGTRVQIFAEAEPGRDPS
jgi:Fur family ferric uptake transcriptional regulator